MKRSAIKSTTGFQVCAFCQNWYDPMNSVIEPGNGGKIWYYETTARRKCRLRGGAGETPATLHCPRFVPKV